MSDEHDIRVRAAAFAFLTEQRVTHGEVFPRDVLARGFIFEDSRVPLIGPQGIFKPAVLRDAPLTITTAPPVPGKIAPYEDEVGNDGLIKYRYRGTDPNHHENVGLRAAMQNRIPLIYLYGIMPSRYMPTWPVYVVGDDPSALCFSVAADDRMSTIAGDRAADSREEARRIYVTAAVQRRLHQQSFRLRVIAAYQQHCAICRLRHSELLEAAHILPDGHPKGFPIVPNGLALCALHHAAFDAHIIGVRPDYVIEVRADILEEVDGPMLQHGLKGFQGSPLILPRNEALNPKREFLEERYAWFKKAV